MAEFVRQGFICPFCMHDCGNFPQLQAHVDNFHPETEPDLTEAVVQNVKGLIDKAKRGMKKLDAKVDISQVQLGVSSSVAELASYTNTVQGKIQAAQERARPVVVRPLPVRPEIGIRRSLTSFFIEERDSSVNESAVLTNTLIIRLDRLIQESPSDPAKRKEFEREVVPWTADSESPVCRGCAIKFGLTKRRHHCRLCGRVMCHSCSCFLSYASARRLTNPAMAAQFEETSKSECEQETGNGDAPLNGRRLLEATQKTTERMKQLLGGAVSRISSDGTEDANECLRVCRSCFTHLERREQMMEQSQAPALVEQYATLDSLLSEAHQMAPAYVRMAESLLNGETMYTLSAAEEMKQRLIAKQRQIDQLSASIVADVDSENMPLKETQLRRNIRYVAVMTIQVLVPSLITLPTKDHYEVLVEKHKHEIAMQIQRSRQRVNEERSLKPSSSMPLIPASSSPVASSRNLRRNEWKQKVEEGWTPQQVVGHNALASDDERGNPLYEQRDNIKSFLSQAAAAGRLDEVEMLERNLKILEEEMSRLGLEL